MLRIVLGLFVTLGCGETGYLLVYAGLGQGVAGSVVGAGTGVVVAYAGYWLLVARLVERRRGIPAELAIRPAARELLVGLAGGSLALLGVIGVIGLLGGVDITPGTAPASSLVIALCTVGVVPGFIEELAFRGVLFRVVDERLGSWVALLLSSVLFGSAHLLNDHATWWSSLTIALEAGVLLGAVYLVTGRLWACVGAHLGWNLWQSWLGLPLSGNEPQPGLLTVRLTGPELLTGGAFGPEASVVSVVCLSVIGCGLLWHAWRHHRVNPVRGTVSTAARSDSGSS